jgi:ketosteroid isomerase-like protein
MRQPGAGVEDRMSALPTVVHRRRHDDPGGPRPTDARWPIDVGDVLAHRAGRNPWVALVADSILQYSAGEADRVTRLWDEEIAWTVDADGPVSGTSTGPHGVFEFHRQLLRRTGGTFKQRLLALESAGGPIVEAHVRTTASRSEASLDVPTLIVFELAGGLLARVREIPGDRSAWREFWAD